MKKIYFLLLLATAIVFASQIATVTGLDPNGDGFLSLRKKPKQREIGKLYNGDKVEILSQSGKYYKVKDVKSGMIGYAHSNWIRKTSNSTTASTCTSQKQGTVHGLDPNGDGFLSVRSKPKGKKIGKLYNGDKVAILGQRGAWYKVRTSSGLVGWSHGNWVRASSENTKRQFSEEKENAIVFVTKRYDNLGKVDEKFKKDKEVVLAAVKNDGLALSYVDNSLKRDKEIVLAAVKKNGFALSYVDDSLKRDKEIVLAAVKKNGFTLNYADHILKQDKEFVLVAVKNDGLALKYVDDSLKKDKEIVLTSVKENGLALEYADDSLKKDKEVVLTAAKNDNLALEYADDSLKKDKEFVLAAIKEDISVLGYVDDSLKKYLAATLQLLSNPVSYEVDIDKASKYYKRAEKKNPIISILNSSEYKMINNFKQSHFYQIKACQKVYGYIGIAAKIVQIKPLLDTAIEYSVECDKNGTIIGLRLDDDYSESWFQILHVKDHNVILKDHTYYKLSKDSLVHYVNESYKEKVFKWVQMMRKNIDKASDSEKKRLLMAEAMLSKEGLVYSKINEVEKLINILKKPTMYLYNIQGYHLKAN